MSAVTAEPIPILAMACQDPLCDFKPIRAHRRPLGEEDVLIEMKYCGVCHSDLHIAAGHLSGIQKPVYPVVPGHELAGVCIKVGSKVTKIKVGDHVGVGCMVDACLKCASCQKGDENYCKKQNTATYQGQDNHGRAATYPTGGRTMGGYSSKMVVHEHFAILIPQSYPLEYAGPIMCAGITMYEPLKKFGAKAGSRVGVIGLGGLGVTGIKLAKALGCIVTAISRGESKRELATKAGADHFLSSTDEQKMKDAAKSLDIILNTIPIEHDYRPYWRLVTEKGKLVQLGLTNSLGAGLMVVEPFTGGKCTITGSGIGGIVNTQEVIDLCDKHKIYPEIKICPVQELNRIYEILDSNNDGGIRFVLDLQGSLNEDAFKSCTADAPKLAEPTKTMSYCGVVSESVSMLIVHWGLKSI